MAQLALKHHRGGSGKPLVLMHGIGSCWRVFDPVIPRLEQHHDVLALDLPGYGRSPALEVEPTVPALVDAMERALDHAGLDRPHLAANSLGGWIAAELAARGRAASVTAISPAGLWTRRELLYSDAVLRVMRAGSRVLAPHADALAGSALGRRLLFGNVCARPERIEPESAAHQVRAYAGAPSLRATLDWIRRNRAMPRGLDAISCPFTVAWGTRDLLLPPRQARRWERLVPGARLVWLPRLGHTPPADDAELVARTILETAASATRSSGPRAAAPA